eukprot:403359903
MPRFDVTYNFKFSEEQFRNLPVWEEIGNQEDDKTVKIRISYSCRKCEIAWITKISTRKLNWGFCNECGVDDAHFNRLTNLLMQRTTNGYPTQVFGSFSGNLYLL